MGLSPILGWFYHHNHNLLRASLVVCPPNSEGGCSTATWESSQADPQAREALCVPWDLFYSVRRAHKILDTAESGSTPVPHGSQGVWVFPNHAACCSSPYARFSPGGHHDSASHTQVLRCGPRGLPQSAGP